MYARREATMPEGATRLLVTYEQAAEMLGISSRQVQRMVKEERALRVVRVGRLVRIPVVELERWIAQHSKYQIVMLTPDVVQLRRRSEAKGAKEETNKKNR